MATTSNSSECYNFINHTSQLIINLSVYGGSASFGALSSLTATVLILVAKEHKEFIYRLMMYMAVCALVSCLAQLINIFETDYSINYEITMPSKLTMLYLIYVYNFLMCWLGLYLFSLAVFRVQLKKTKHEAIGLVTVLVTPLTFVWVFPWKKRSGDFCDDTYSLKQIKLVLFYDIPVFLLVLLSCLFIGAVLAVLCKNSFNRSKNTLQQQHRKAVKETIPFVVFMTAHQIRQIMAVVILACQLYLAEGGEKAGTLNFILWQSHDLWPLVFVCLPILLVCQPRIRRRIKCKWSQKHINMNVTSEHGKTISQSHPSSYTHYSSPHESSHTTTGNVHNIIAGHTHYNGAADPDGPCASTEKEPLLRKFQC